MPDFITLFLRNWKCVFMKTNWQQSFELFTISSQFLFCFKSRFHSSKTICERSRLSGTVLAKVNERTDTCFWQNICGACIGYTTFSMVSASQGNFYSRQRFLLQEHLLAVILALSSSDLHDHSCEKNTDVVPPNKQRFYRIKFTNCWKI